MNITPIKTKIFNPKENLFKFIIENLKKIPERSIIVITSKIVALSENRIVPNTNPQNKVKMILQESEYAWKSKFVWLTIKDKMIMASAGIDESNAKNQLILLPKNSFKSAKKLHKQLLTHYRVKQLGVLITDSRTSPLRAGVTGVALGYAGFRGIKDYRGKRDIFGRKFKFSRVNIADSLATSAVLLMGEGNEKQPLAVLTKTPVKFCDKVYPKELHIAPQDDMYLPFLKKLQKLQSKK